MDVQAINIGDLLFRSAKYFPNKVALIFEDKRITYGELNKRVNSLSNALIDMGIEKGDHVAILFYNSPQYIEAFFAASKAGAVVAPLNFRLAPRELTYQVDNADSSMLIYSEDFREVVDSIRPQLPKVKSYICDGKDLPPSVFNYEELITRHSDSEPGVNVGGEDGCVMYYTAGTTGLPKGVLRTHWNALWNSIGMTWAFPFAHNDIILVFPPLFHLAGGECFYLPTLSKSATFVTAKAFDAVKAVETIQREKVTKTFLVPAMSVAIWNLPDIDEYDLSSLRAYATAAAPLPTELKRRITKKLPHIELIEMYGMSEASPIAYLPAEYALRKDMCVGISGPHTKMKVVDDEGNDVPQGEVGEIVVQGPGIAREYYKEPQKTAETIINGWLHTGDLGRLDEDGFLYIVDRKKDMVLTGGENVYSAEVEDVLFKHPKILETAIIGLPDEKWGERVTAVVVLKPGEKATEEELISFCRERLASYKCPKQVIFQDTPLPRTSFGKVLKRELRATYAEKA